MKREFKVLLGVSLFLLSSTSAYCQTNKMTNSTTQGLVFSKQTLEKFNVLSKIRKIENLIYPDIRSQKVAILPFQNKCSFKSLNKEDIISELEPLDYIIYFDSNKIRKDIFLSLTHSEQIPSQAKAFIVSKFMAGLVNQNQHDLIRELLSLEFPSSTRINAVQNYLQCLLISGDQQNLRNLYQLSTATPKGTDFFRLLSQEETLSPVLHEIINYFFRSSGEEFSKSRIYPPFETFVQAFDPASRDQLRGTVASHWVGSDLLEKAVNQVLETGTFSSTRKIIESKQRFDDQIKRIIKTSPRAEFLTFSDMSPSILGKRSAESMKGSTPEIQTSGHQTIERIEKKQQLTRDRNAGIFGKDQNQSLDPSVTYGSYERKESEWLSSLGILGQSGLYTSTDLPAEKTILTYVGKIYDSEEALFEVFPEDTWDDRRETDYLLDVSNEEGELLYIVSGLEAQNGESPSSACLINHTVPELANVEFKSIPNANAHKGYQAVVMTKGPIEAGTELKVFYGEEMHQKILEKNPEFKKFVEENFPHHLPKKSPSRKSPLKKKRIFSSYSSTPKISRLTNSESLNQSSSKNSKRGDTSKASPEFLSLLDRSDQLFREASKSSEESHYKQAENKLSEAINHLKKGFDLLSKSDQSISRKDLRILKYNLDFRLADLYWELALNSSSLSQHFPILSTKKRYGQAQVYYFSQAKHFYAEQHGESSDSKKNEKAAAVQEQLARNRINDLEENPTQVIQEDLQVSYETSFVLKQKADHLVQSGIEREKAISFYEIALQYIHSEYEGSTLDHGYHQYLEADLNWSLGEVYQDAPINDLGKARKCYERAIFLYQNLLQDYSGILQADVSLVLEDVRTHLALAQSSLESFKEFEILPNSL